MLLLTGYVCSEGRLCFYVWSFRYSFQNTYLLSLSHEDIPYFQEVIVMASTCDACGYRNSEVCSCSSCSLLLVHVLYRLFTTAACQH